MTATQEGTKNTIYKANGGKDNMLYEKANRKAIKKEVPKEHREEVMKKHENLKKIYQTTLDDERGKVKAYTMSEAEKAKHRSIIDNYDSQIKTQNELKQEAIKAKNIPAIAEHQQNADNLIKLKREEIKSFQNIKPQVQKSDIQKMNSDNAHFLTGYNDGQIAVDVKSSDMNSRGKIRATFDYDVDKQGRAQFKFSDYTNKHAYSEMHGYGESYYYKAYQNYDNNLKVKNTQMIYLTCNQQPPR